MRAVTGASLDQFDPADVGILRPNSDRTVTVNATGQDNYQTPTSENATEANVIFNLLQGSYNYTINNFLCRRSIKF